MELTPKVFKPYLCLNKSPLSSEALIPRPHLECVLQLKLLLSELLQSVESSSLLLAAVNQLLLLLLHL